MRLFILIIPFLLSVGSCVNYVEIKNDSSEDLKVLNSTFLQIIGTNFYRMPYPDSVNNLDSSRIVIFVNDTLKSILLTDSTISEYSDIVLRDKLLIDTAYLLTYHRLFNTSFTPLKIDVKKIENVGLYTILSTQDSSEIKKKNRIVGTLTFSRVSFNSDKTRCCFYVSLDCGNDCGYGYLVFCKNLNHKWQKEYEISLFQR